MTACIIGVRNVGGNSNMERGHNCFVCGNKKSGYDLPLLVEPKSEGEALVQLFNKTIPNCAWLDYRSSEYTYLQVKIYACDEHESNLHKLSKIIDSAPATEKPCVFKTNHMHSLRQISESAILQSKEQH